MGSNMGHFLYNFSMFNDTQPFADIAIRYCTKKAVYFHSMYTNVYLEYKHAFPTTFSQTPG
jgi:hypothetical protein